MNTYTEIDINQSLEQYFGFDAFKGKQEQIIQSILGGKDTFVIMPTGGGKSLCYQLPALMQPGTAIVISPLIALMKNQVDAIRGYCNEDSVAHFLNSSLKKSEIQAVKEDIKAGNTKLLFVAPETLVKEENIAFFNSVTISFVAVDEAHCISEWGHDFRPEYRKIRSMVNKIGEHIPIIALTATATPKVQSDIVKNLQLNSVNTFISSFNRDNLYYIIKPKIQKKNAITEIVKFIKKHAKKSGIIYVQSRKSTEEIAEVLQVNGINAAPYHAGLDSKTRNKVQDDFLMEQIDVIVATIAFGMGIDKPDVRFVIHYDIPKSIENYYQETGRAGRDGMEGICLSFYDYKDVQRLEKFLKDKSVSDRELGLQLMDEVMGYCETGDCRRKYLLHYFGEEYDDAKCNNMCDNCKHPKPIIKIKDEMVTALSSIDQLKENYGIKVMVDYLLGIKNKDIREQNFDKLSYFASGKEQDGPFWYTTIRKAMLLGFVHKVIEQYGVLKLTDKARAYLKNPTTINLAINRDHQDTDGPAVIDNTAGSALDDTLLNMLKDLRNKEANRLGVKPWIIFLEPSLVDMATYYPITMGDMLNISGVSKGKASKYAKPFVDLIADYVESNDIERPDEIVVKQVADKSKAKVAIIQGTDRKMPLEDIANRAGIELSELLEEMNMIVTSGTKLDLDYYIEDNIDEDVVDEIYDYFDEAESDSVDDAHSELSDDDITIEEIQVVRLKYLSEFAN